MQFTEKIIKRGIAEEGLSLNTSLANRGKPLKSPRRRKILSNTKTSATRSLSRSPRAKKLQSDTKLQNEQPTPSLKRLTQEQALEALQQRENNRRNQASIVAARRNLLEFACRMDGTYVRARHLELVSELLARVFDRRIKRLMLFLPPRHGKSKLATELWPAWCLGKDPSRQFIVATHTQALSNTFSRNARNMIKTLEYQEIFPAAQLSGDQANVQEWTLADQTRPSYIAVGVGGAPTGKGATDLILDDLIQSASEANSANARETIYDWYKSTIRPRLEPNATITMIMQRWHGDDIAGRLIRDQFNGGEKWTICVVPAIAMSQSQRDELHTKMYGLPAGLPDPLGRAEGEALWPERWPVRELAPLVGVDPRSWEAKYQQSPRPAEGALFKRAWLERIVDSAPQGLRWMRFYDPAYSIKTTADNTATISGALAPDGTLYFRRGRAGRMEAPDFERMVVELMQSERGEHGIEKSVHGGAAVQSIMRNPVVAGIGLRAVTVDGDKISRATPLATRAEIGKVCFVRESVNDDAWIKAWIDEMVEFPFGAHDDRVDAASGVLAMTSTVSRGVFL